MAEWDEAAVSKRTLAGLNPVTGGFVFWTGRPHCRKNKMPTSQDVNPQQQQEIHSGEGGGLQCSP